jgi:hypothetical protein
MPSLTVLTHLARHPELDSTNLSAYLVEHFDALHALVGLPKAELEGMKDGQLAPLVASKLELHRSMLARQRQGVARERVERAAAMLQRGRPLGLGIQLDPSLFFRDLLADPSTHAIQMRLPEVDLLFCRPRLQKMAAVLCRKTDLVVWVDARGLHLRWNNGRGGLNLRPDLMPGKPVRVLAVDLRRSPEPTQATEPQAQPAPRRPRLPEPALEQVPSPPSNPSPSRARRRTWVDFLSFL